MMKFKSGATVAFAVAAMAFVAAGCGSDDKKDRGSSGGGGGD